MLALAVIDDLGAIVVIAAFYSSGISLVGLGIAVAAFLAVLTLQRFGVRARLAYLIPALVAWTGIYAAGIHPTIAGVSIGLMTPVRAWIGPGGFVRSVRHNLERLAPPVAPHALDAALDDLELARREARSPADTLIRTLHPWVAFGIMPIFALANSGVAVSVDALDSASWRVISGVSLGLVLGKPIGVLVASTLVLRSKVATMPRGIGKAHLIVLGVVAGVGFTMALFIAQLAFVDASLLEAAKLGILAASGGAAVIGLALGRLLLSPMEMPGAARTADDAERSTEM